jgi:4-hydroxythreonine-4-phosphate dehydrogenase
MHTDERTSPARLLVTMGDVAGIGPEIIARAWPQLVESESAWPVVVGDVGWLEWAVRLVGSTARVQPITHLAEAAPTPEQIPCLTASTAPLHAVVPGQISPAAGQAAFDFLVAAIDLTLAGQADAIVTAPLHKEALRAAGVPWPGHTEILAHRCGRPEHAMLLYAERPGQAGLAVIHVTLHLALREVFAHLSEAAVLEKIRLLDTLLPRLIGRPPRLAVAALNPHASDGGLFGDEEARLIAPAVAAAQRAGIHVSGPWPADTLFLRAVGGEFDGVVAMYHDQGHIAMKLHCGRAAVNITAGLPIVRTSVAHGTAFDIAGRGVADASSLVTAARVAARLAQSR